MIIDTEPAISGSKRRAMFRQHDIQAIADLVHGCKMTEREACITLDFKPEQWNSWKSKHKRAAFFDTLLARTRGLQTKELISRISGAGLDKEIELPNGKTMTKTGDWRANAFILEKTVPQFAPAQQSAAPVVTIQIGLIHEQLKRVIGFDDIKAIEQPKLKMPIRKTSAGMTEGL